MFNLNWEKLQDNLPKGTILEKKVYAADNRFWKISKNEQNVGSAIIRLLPDPEFIPFVKVFYHNLSKFDPVLGKDRFYIEDSPMTIGERCPVSEQWQSLMKLGTTESKNQAMALKRKIKYITNIQVIKDPGNPENNGKIFLWTYGTKLHDRFMAAMKPTDDEIELGGTARELFDPFNGCSILLKTKKNVSGFFDYDDTQVMQPTAIFKTEDEAMDVIKTKCHKLSEFLSPEHYTSYEELVIKFDKYQHGAKSKYVSLASADAKATPDVTEDDLAEMPEQAAPVAKPKQPASAPVSKAKAAVTQDDDDLDALLAELENE